MALTKINNRMIDGASVNARDFGAVGDGVTDDTAAIQAAAAGITDNNFLVLEPNRSYYLPTLSSTDISRVKGNNSKLIIHGGTSYFTKNLKNLHYEDIQFVTIGGKQNSTNTGSNNKLFLDSTNDSVRIKNMSHVALSDINDSTSWSDDVAKSRYSNTFTLVADDIDIDGLYSYGVGSLLRMKPKTHDVSKHSINNVEGYNVETLVWVDSTDYDNMKWLHGKATNLRVLNTEAQQGYWNGSEAGTGNNGKDVILCTSDHTRDFRIKGISSWRPIERSVYHQSSNTQIEDVRDTFSVSGGAMHKDQLFISYNVIARNLSTRSTTGAITDLQLYGNNQCSYDGLEYKCQDTDNQRRVIGLGDSNRDTEVRNLYADNANCLLYINTNSADTIGQERLSFSDIELRGIYSGDSEHASLLTYRGGDTFVYPVFNDLRIENITHIIDSSVPQNEINKFAVYAPMSNNVNLVNIQSHCRWYPFSMASSTDVTCLGSAFYLHTNQNIGVILATMDTDDFSASRFDFDVLAYDDGILDEKYSIKFRKMNDTGMVKCVDHIVNIDYDLTLEDNDSLFRNIPMTGAYKTKCAFGDSYIETIHNNGADTVIVNSGTAFSETDWNNSIRIYSDVDGSVTIRRNSTSMTGGQITLTVTKI